jgi:AcrR family transcriptional regulator
VKPKSAPSTRWRRRAEARPDEILDAALEAFEAQGFDAARVEDIAARAGLSKAGVYLYFDSKAALLEALIRREVAPVAARAEAIAAAGAADPPAALRAIATVAFAAFSNPRFFAVPRLVLSISNRFPEIAAVYRAEVIDRARGALIAIVRAGIARGDFRAVNPEAAVRIIAGPMMMEGLLRHVFGARDIIVDPPALLELALSALAPERAA